MTRLYLIRHGESYPNIEPIVGGMKGDRGLTPLGISQAERLRDRLAGTGEIKADVLIASTLPRAQQTAQIIAPALGLPIISRDDVQEIRVGEADGMQVADAHAKYGMPDFEKDPFRPIAPGGENWPQFVLRVATALNDITREYAGKTIVVVCHGGVIDSSLISFFDMPTFSLTRTRFYTINTSITCWEQATRQKTGEQFWRLVYYNDATHLREVGARDSIQWEDVEPTPEGGSQKPAAPIPTEEETA
jgi:Fructose-2,6-bisphosphatase